VQLNAEAWDRLITWIDLNAPFHGSWTEAQGAKRVGTQRQRRGQLRLAYAGMTDDPEAGADVAPPRVVPVAASFRAEPAVDPTFGPDWPLNPVEAKRRQQNAGETFSRTVDLGQGTAMELMLVPAGEFVMGESTGWSDERPAARIRIEKPFWMGTFEVTNEQYGRFDPTHDSRYAQTHGITAARGFPLNRPSQPAVRVSWYRALDFCRWLSQRTGDAYTLPTEAQWEYACRAGTATPWNYGSLDADFSAAGNMADRNLEHLLAWNHLSRTALLPRDSRFDDGAILAAPAGSYRPNAWGLCDMHGNAAEWTRSVYQPYPYCDDDGRNDPGSAERRVVRGGSWRDRPAYCRSASRLPYPAWLGVHNVGFRVVRSER
jgi:formylglycine-generating enzyme required for sulfatase activity